MFAIIKPHRANYKTNRGTQLKLETSDYKGSIKIIILVNIKIYSAI